MENEEIQKRISSNNKGCKKYIESQDRICGNWYSYLGKEDKANFIDKDEFGYGGWFLCRECLDGVKG